MEETMRITFVSLIIIMMMITSAAFAGGNRETVPAPQNEETTAEPEGSGFTVIDSSGKTVEFSAIPQRIVSISPSNTELLFAVGGGDKVVGVTDWCNYPPEAQTKEKVGGFSVKSLSVEKVISLNPDVVLGDSSMHAEVAPIIEASGIPVLLIEAGDFEEMYSNILIAGKVTAREAEARELTASLRERVSAVRDGAAEIDDSEKKHVFWEIYDNPLMTAGSETFIGQLITTAGGINIFADAEGSWPKVSTEELISRDPDVIISSNSHGGELKREDVIARPGWSQLTAIQNDQLFLIGEDKVSRPGPRLIDGLEQVAEILYPETFR